MIILSIIFAHLMLISPNLQVENTTRTTWYGEAFHGNKTANGEIFNMNALTCASPTLPFNTRIKITNPSNNKTVIVRVNDRGPWEIIEGKYTPHPTRAFDLSKSAFQSIADLSRGVITVKFEILK